MGRTQLPCRHRGPRRWLRRCVRRPQASEGALRPRCCHRRSHRYRVPPTRGGPAPAGCGRAPPWPAPPSGPTHAPAPAPRSRAAPRAPAPSGGTAAAAPSPGSRAGPADPCRERAGGQWSEQGMGTDRDTETRQDTESQRQDTQTQRAQKRQMTKRQRRPKGRKGWSHPPPPFLT